MTESRANTALAWTLGVLAAVSLVVGLYAFIWPHSFYDHVLGVDRLPPYNQHLLTDVGGFYLGFAVLFAWAAADRGRALVLAAWAAWIVIQALHLGYHVTHLEHFSVGTAVAQTVLLAAAPAVAVAAALLGTRISGHRTREPGERDQGGLAPVGAHRGVGQLDVVAPAHRDTECRSRSRSSAGARGKAGARPLARPRAPRSRGFTRPCRRARRFGRDAAAGLRWSRWRQALGLARSPRWFGT